MKTRATARFIRVPASKARLVLDHIRGKSAGEALALLQFTPKAAARLIEKVLRSAIANAEHNHQVRDLDDLRVVRATADGGPSMKRVSPRAMGRAFFVKHRTSHLTIELSDETARRLERSLCRPGDIVFTKKGTLGQTGLVPSSTSPTAYDQPSNTCQRMSFTLSVGEFG